MMTVTEAERMHRAAEKGRSASFCVPGAAHLSISVTRSSHDLPEASAFAGHHDLMQGSNLRAQLAEVPQARVREAAGARRSQSCRVQGSKPPRVVRRDPSSGRGSIGGLNQEVIETFFGGPDGTPPRTGEPPEEETASYNPFLKKGGSCGRLVTLSPDEELRLEDSPTLRRSASARRPRNLPTVTTRSPSHSPTPTRTTKGPAPTGGGSTKPRAFNKKGSSKRGHNSSPHPDTKGGAMPPDTLDTEAYLLRNFATTNKGIINRGDSFRRRRSRSNSIQPPPDVGPVATAPQDLSPITSSSTSSSNHSEPKDPLAVQPERYRVAIFGAPGVGKTALINQFRTSECINAYDCSNVGEEEEQVISIVLNSIESEIVFVNLSMPYDLQSEMCRIPPPHGWVVVYSITDKSSFQKAKEDLEKLQESNLIKGRVVIVVGNKCELVRSRAVPIDDGRDLAVSHGGKFMEISVGINHKCDELLVGILHQLRLKEEAAAEGLFEEKKSSWTRNRSLMRASLKAKRVINKIIGKSDSKHKQCEDFLN